MGKKVSKSGESLMLLWNFQKAAKVSKNARAIITRVKNGTEGDSNGIYVNQSMICHDTTHIWKVP